MSERKDAIVVGASIGGLVAAAYLARAGHRVLLLEAEEALGGNRSGFGGDALYALDPRLVTDLRLRDLKFAVRDMPLVALRPDGRPLVLGRDMRAASRAIAVYSPRDAETYRKLRSEVLALARAMRPFWWDGADAPLPSNASQNLLLARTAATSAMSFLSAFESDAVKTALAFDAGVPFEPGSALALVWRAAQEMCGLQGTVATPRGGLGALIDALAAAAQKAGVEIRTNARVSRFLLDGDAVSGVALESGETIASRTILSCLPRRATLLDFVPVARAGFAETQRLMRSVPRTGEASILFLLNAAPEFGGTHAPQTARFVVVDRSDSYVAASTAVREGQLPDDLLLEVTVPTAADPSMAPHGQHIVSVRIPALPLAPSDGWPALTGKLVERVVATLEPHTPYLRTSIVGVDTRMPLEEEPVSNARLMAPYAARVATPIAGLFLCGSSAEPMNAISGRAGRHAAAMAKAFLAREKRA